ncbi:MAG TPA: hypothetical protein VKX46_13720 [Ktedonobacteraceae bacterium]|nr:hypothetical protein [Ktedonobacteraceae bacterium]
MTLHDAYHIHPIHVLPELVVQGEDPWFVLNGFLHDWWCYAVDQRDELILTPPSPGDTLEQQQWAAFTAAVVEELCNRVNYPHPAWIFHPDYQLTSPWFVSSQPHDTLEPFTRRNVFVSKTVLDNKYELRALYGKNQLPLWSEQEMNVLFPMETEGKTS